MGGDAVEAAAAATAEAEAEAERIYGRRHVELRPLRPWPVVLEQHEVEVQIVELGRVLALDVVPPVADPVLLVEYASPRAEERGLAPARFADMEHLRIR